jgi:nucleoid DNA-binding protein
MITEAEAPLSKITDSDGASSAPLTKENLIEEVCRVVEIPRKEAAIIVERILDSMVHALDRGDKVEIRGFGSFRTRYRRAHASDVIRKPGRGSKCPPREFRFSSRARNSANWSTRLVRRRQSRSSRFRR